MVLALVLGPQLENTFRQSLIMSGGSLGIFLFRPAAAALLVTQGAYAETPVGADKQTGIAVTIYNNDLALVRDSRSVTLSQGENDIAFIEVSAGIRPEKKPRSW